MGNQDRKRIYVDAAYEILRTEGLEGISIRKVAESVGSSSAALYKHFENLDDLVSLASIRFLTDYYRDTRLLAKVDLDPLQLNIQLWECLAYYAFKDVPIFEYMFFSDATEHMESTIFDYYHLFPEEMEGMRSYIIANMSIVNLFDRDFTFLVRGVSAGLIDMDSACYLRDMDIYLFRGMLATYHSSYKNEKVRREATRHLLELLVKNYNSQLLPGHTILTVSPIIDTSARA